MRNKGITLIALVVTINYFINIVWYNNNNVDWRK